MTTENLFGLFYKQKERSLEICSLNDWIQKNQADFENYLENGDDITPQELLLAVSSNQNELENLQEGYHEVLNRKDYTFYLREHSSIRYSPGPYDQATRTPRYKIDVHVPKHVEYQIETKDYLMGVEGNRSWYWEITNGSNYPAFVTIWKDGVEIPYSE